ncbi:MAG: FmdB family transcriptional regulator [Acidimicrobiia bacterium]|nr:FmdB family transcriptional regulator [Acidimicrobiia bacterium]
MPIYQYKCRVCDEHFDVEQSFTDETLTEIDGCSIDESGRHRVKKVFAAPAISFKGDGFYRNDARSSGASTSTTSADGKSTDSSADSAPKSDPSTGKSSESSSSSSSSSADKAASSSGASSNSSSD